MFALPLTLTDSVEIKYGVIFPKKAKLTSPKYDIHYTRPIQGLENLISLAFKQFVYPRKHEKYNPIKFNVFS